MSHNTSDKAHTITGTIPELNHDLARAHGKAADRKHYQEFTAALAAACDACLKAKFT